MMKRKFEHRFVYFLLLSCVLHLVFFLVFLRSSSKPPIQEKKPILVDLIEKPVLIDTMEVDKHSSEEPASLSQNTDPAILTAEKPSLPLPLPPPSELKTPEPSQPEKSQQTAANRPSKTQRNREPVLTTPEDPLPDVTIQTSPLPDEPRKLPTIKELMPSLQRLLALENADRSLYHDPVLQQDGRGNLPAQAKFNAYLAELKRRVKQNWRISTDYFMHDSSTVLLVTINSDGTLESVVQMKSSGMPTHDFETIAAVRQSFPLRSPSKELLNEQGKLLIRFSFHYIVRPPL